MGAIVQQVADLTSIERRVLSYLDQRGGREHRRQIVTDLSSPDAKWNRGGGGGSNGAAPLIVGAWCRRLVGRGWVQVRYDREGFYREHAITEAGRRAIRNG